MKKFTIDYYKKEIYLDTNSVINQTILKEFPDNFTLEKKGDKYKYTFQIKPTISFVLLAFIYKYKKHFEIEDGVIETLKKEIEMVYLPRVFMYDSDRVGIECPSLPFYQNILKDIGSRELMFNLHTVPAARAFDVLRKINVMKSFLPEFKIEEDVKKILYKPLPSYDGSVASLATGCISEIKAAEKAWNVKIENFAKIGYHNIIDFLLKRPRRYIDRSGETDLSTVIKGEEVSIVGVIIEKRVINFKHALFEIKTSDEKVIQMTFWNQSWRIDKIKLDEEVLVIGKYDRMMGKKYIINPTGMESLLETKSLPIIPIYSQSGTNKITTKIIMHITQELFARLSPFESEMMTYFDCSLAKMRPTKAIKSLHFPEDIDDYKTALESLALYELILLQMLILYRKETEVKKQGIRKNGKENDLIKTVIKNLPYKLTKCKDGQKGQKDALDEIFKILKSDSSEKILLIGDVGCGKSIVSQLACLHTIDSGFQVVMAGPTEVLARQLYETFKAVLELIPIGIRPHMEFLSGETKAKEKKLILEGVRSGSVKILVGTHSVLNPSIPYKNLGLIVVDEEQKFSAGQREALMQLETNGVYPDLISQSATPIPQSTARVMHGDIEFIKIDMKPPGRLPITTIWENEKPMDITKNKDHEIWKDFKSEIKKGYQAFIVTPMVFESAKMDAASVEETYKDLLKIFPDIKIEYLHGAMKKSEQAERMERFRKNESSIMIASTVIEVGVDVRNATRIAILSADRLGASSLHQVRGRVGRNNIPAKCYLVSNSKTPSSHNRLNALVESNDGFKIALTDLRTRGEGDLFSGSRQSGDSSLMFATLVDHSDLIDTARSEAERIFKSKNRDIALRDANALLKRNEEE